MDADARVTHVWHRHLRRTPPVAVAGSVGVGIWAGLGDITVTYVVGYVALALALARASSLVWQRSKRPPADPDVAATEHPPERVAPHV